MLPFVVLGLGVLWWLSRTSESSSPGVSSGPLTPPVPGATNAFWGNDDPAAWSWPSFQPWTPTAPSDPFFDGWLGISSRKLPSGYSHGAIAGGAEAPIQSGERVVFQAKRADGTTAGFLEGTYAGPEDPSSGEAVINVDRIADKGTGELLSYGKYTIPASSKSGYHDKLERVKWYAISPSEEGLRSFDTPRLLTPGTKATAVVRDLHGNVVIAIVDVRSVSGNTFNALLTSVYRAIDDEGVGPITFPRVHSQALITMRQEQLVDPASIPSLTS